MGARVSTRQCVRAARLCAAVALAVCGAAEAARGQGEIAAQDAANNLGFPRTTNVPTLPLDLLHRRHRAAYTISVARIVPPQR